LSTFLTALSGGIGKGSILAWNAVCSLIIKVFPAFFAFVNASHRCIINFGVCSAVSTDNSPITVALLALGASVWARLAGQGSVIKPLSDRAGPVQVALLALIN
jgi:hypothetical protein